MPSTPDDWARQLKRDWEARAALDSRDLFVASHAGWNVGNAAAVQQATETLATDMAQVIANLTPEERRLAFETYYMGDRFRYAELMPFLRELTGGEVALYRGDPGCIYAAVSKAK